MPSANHSPVYNAPIPQMLLRTLGLAHAIGLLLWLWLLPVGFASQWSTLETQLAQKIAATTGPGAVALDVVNRSSLSQTDVDQIRRELLAELGGLGVHFVAADQAAATVQVSLSENLQSYVWVAEVHLGNNESSLAMVAAPRSERVAGERPAAPMTIRKTLLWTDENRILDVGMPNSQTMILLEPESVVLLTLQSGRWQQAQTLSITHRQPWPRDLRGRLLLRKDHLFDAYLPGVLCQSTTVAPLGLNCRESDDPWPLATDEFALRAFFASTRNFFTGVLSPGIQKQTATSAFYSAAPLPRGPYTLWVFSGVDGQIHLLDGVTDQTAAKLGWGSDIAGVRSSCGLAWQILATSRSDGPSDTVTAFEMADREPMAVSPPAEFSGSITALWAAPEGSSALAVSHDLELGKYEAYRLSIACGQ